MKFRSRGRFCLAFFSIGFIACAILPTTALGQEDEIDSPFRWREKSFRLGLFGGQHSANRGSLEFGQGPASAIGAKMRARVSSPLSLEVGATFAPAERWVLNPIAESGPIIMDTVSANWRRADFGAQVGLTGARTWNGIHPYALIGGGLVFGIMEGASEVMAPPEMETFRYDISTAPHIYVGFGFEVFPSETIGIGFEVRDYLIRLSAPDGFLSLQALQAFESTGGPAPDASTYQHNPEFGITIWYYF